MSIVGSGYVLSDINAALSSFARRARAMKHDGAALQAWFDRACGAVNNGSNVTTRATTLKGKIEDDGGTISQGDAEALVAAFDEVLYWAATFAPTVTLDVSGPNL